MNLTALDSVRSTKVPLGINLVFYGLQLMVFSIIMMMFLPMFLSGNLQLLISVLFIFSLMLIAATALSLLGKVLCLSAPNEMLGKTSIYLAVLFDVLAVGLAIALIFTELPPIFDTISNILSIAGLVCFLVFLRALSQYIADENLVRRSKSLLMIGITLIVFWLLAIASAFFLPLGAVFFGLIVLVLGIMALLRYSRLLLELVKVMGGKSPVT